MNKLIRSLIIWYASSQVIGNLIFSLLIARCVFSNCTNDMNQSLRHMSTSIVLNLILLILMKVSITRE